MLSILIVQNQSQESKTLSIAVSTVVDARCLVVESMAAALRQLGSSKTTIDLVFLPKECVASESTDFEALRSHPALASARYIDFQVGRSKVSELVQQLGRHIDSLLITPFRIHTLESVVDKLISKGSRAKRRAIVLSEKGDEGHLMGDCLMACGFSSVVLIEGAPAFEQTLAKARSSEVGFLLNNWEWTGEARLPFITRLNESPTWTKIPWALVTSQTSIECIRARGTSCLLTEASLSLSANVKETVKQLREIIQYREESRISLGLATSPRAARVSRWAEMLVKGNSVQVEVELKRALVGIPFDTALRLFLAKSLLKQKKYSASCLELRRILRLEPSLAEAQVLLKIAISLASQDISSASLRQAA